MTLNCGLFVSFISVLLVGFAVMGADVGVRGRGRGGKREEKKYCGSDKTIIVRNERGFHTYVYLASIRAINVVAG